MPAIVFSPAARTATAEVFQTVPPHRFPQTYGARQDGWRRGHHALEPYFTFCLSKPEVFISGLNPTAAGIFADDLPPHSMCDKSFISVSVLFDITECRTWFSIKEHQSLHVIDIGGGKSRCRISVCEYMLSAFFHHSIELEIDYTNHNWVVQRIRPLHRYYPARVTNPTQLIYGWLRGAPWFWYPAFCHKNGFDVWCLSFHSKTTTKVLSYHPPPLPPCYKVFSV